MEANSTLAECRLVICSKGEQHEATELCANLGVQPVLADSATTVIALHGHAPCDAVVVLPSAVAELARLAHDFSPPLIVFNPQATLTLAIEELRQGADFFVISVGELATVLHQITIRKRSQSRSPWSPKERAILAKVVNRSGAMNQLVERVRQLAAAPSTTALVYGESGTGKELVARVIHELSERAERPFVPVDCGAIPETLIESELFGHVRGAFSGAHADRAGRMELANGGTLFLDELGELPLHMQAKFLRALEERVVWPVGAERPVKIDVRVISATNKNLEEMVQDNRFRLDLYHRVSVFVLNIPPLRARGADVLHLADFFVDQFNREWGRKVAGITREAQAKLVAYEFPGNVRELRNVIENAMVSCQGDHIDAADLNLLNHLGPAAPTLLPAGIEPGSFDTLIAVRWGPEAMHTIERDAIRQALIKTQGNRTQAAALLGIQRSVLLRAIGRHQLNIPAPRGRVPKRALVD